MPGGGSASGHHCERDTRLSVVGQRYAVERIGHQCLSVSIVDGHRRREGHPSSPALRRFGMYCAQDYPSLSRATFYNRGRTVGILANHIAPPAQLGTILPILIKRLSVSTLDLHCFLMNSFEFIRVVIEPDTRRRQIQIVID